jgi:hypothetical protein
MAAPRDGVKEGMGIKAFTVDDDDGLRTYEGGRAKIEGSKHLSGATGPTDQYSTDPNGAPHVDESLIFNFDDAYTVPAQSVGVTVSDFDSEDMLDVYMELLSGDSKVFTSLDLSSTGVGGAALFTNLGDDKLWELNFAILMGLLDTDVLTDFTLRAVEGQPDDPSEKADHFYVSGMSFDDVTITELPEPATMTLLAIGGVAMLRRKRN